MRTLDRYILRHFLFNFAILATIFSVLFLLVSLVVDLDEYVKRGETFAPDLLNSKLMGTLWAALDYNLPILVLLFVYFVGLLCVAAMGFTFTQLYRKRELLAMIAGGISLYRVALPVVAASFIINLAALPVQEFLLPKLAPMLLRSRGADPAHVERVTVNFITDDQGNLFYANNFVYATGTLTDLVVMVRDKSGMALSSVQATEAVWDKSKKQWILKNGVVRFQKDRELRSKPIEGFRSNLSPTVLIARQNPFFLRLMSLSDMLTLTGNKSIDTSQVTLVIHGRFSLIGVNLLVLLIGLPFFLLREPANLMVQGLMASATCIGVWGTGVMLLQSPIAGNPVAAAWLPIALLLPIATWMLTRIRT
jgi:lipopolysaccharide export system permease protein